jgi:hypothetical protein
MSKKSLYLVVGFLWAMLLGIGAGLAATAVAAGVAWIYLFGDSTWPDWTNWAIPGFGLAIGLATFAATVMVTRIVASRHGTPDGERADDRRGGSIAWGLLALGLAVAVGFAWQQYRQNLAIERAYEGSAAAARYLPLLLSETHRIAGISVEWPGGDQDGRAIVTLDGLRSGVYRLDWQVRDSIYEKPLLKSGETLQLAAGSRVMDFTLPAQGIVDGYRTLLNRTDANVMVDEPFVFEMQLAPILSERETSRMSQHEIQNLANGWSPLIQRSSAEFPVRFFLYGETLSWD